MIEYDREGIAIDPDASPRRVDSHEPELLEPYQVIVTAVEIPFGKLVDLVAKVVLATVLALLMLAAGIAVLALLVLLAIR